MCESNIVVCEKLASTPEDILAVIKAIATASNELRQVRIVGERNSTNSAEQKEFLSV